jgi:hypothetical protein
MPAEVEVVVEVVEGAGIATQEPPVQVRHTRRHGTEWAGLPTLAHAGPVDVVVGFVGEFTQRVVEHRRRARGQGHGEADLASAVGAFRAGDAVVAAGPAELAPARAIGDREQQKAALADRRELPGHARRGRILAGGLGQGGQQRGDGRAHWIGCAVQHSIQVPLSGDLVQQDSVERGGQHGRRRCIRQADQGLGFGTVATVDHGQYSVCVRRVLGHERQVQPGGGGH